MALVALVAVITSMAVLHGQAAAASARPAYYQQSHDRIARLLHAGHQAAAKTGAAQAANSSDPEVDGGNPLFTADQFAFGERAAPGTFINPKAVIRGQQQAAAMANAGNEFTWQELGPRTLNNGNFFPEPVSGRLLAVAIDPQNSGIIYVGSAQGGIWKSTNGGRDWRPLTDFLPSLAINTIAIDAKSPNIIFAGTGENNLSCDSYQGQGILRSTNGGQTWTVLGQSLFAGSGIGNIILDPRFEGNASHEHLIVGAGFAGRSNSSTESCDGSLPAGSSPPNGVFLSTDGGQTFTETLNAAPLGISDMVASPADPSVVYAAAQIFGIFKSTDAGHTWVNLNASPTSGLPAPASGFDRVQLTISAADPNVLYSVYSNVVFLGTHMQAFRTTDGGATWTNLTSVPDVCDGQCWYDMPITASPTDPNTVFIGGSANYPYVFTLLGQPTPPADCTTIAALSNLPTNCNATIAKSSDGGKTWQDIGLGDVQANGFPKGSITLHPDDHAIVFDPNHPNVMYTGGDGGLFFTTDGGHSWNNLNPGLGTLQFQGVSVSPNGQIFGGTQDNGTEKFTRQTGTTWTSVDGGDGGLAQVDPSNPNIIYHTFAFSSLQRSTDDGQTFQEIDFPFFNDNASFYPAFSLAPSQSSTLYYGTYRIWRTDDKGGTGSNADWKVISPNLEPSNCAFNCIVDVAVSPVNPNVVVVAGGDGKIWQSTNADSSSPTWTRIDTAVNPNRFPTQIVFAPGSQSTIYITYSGFNSNTGSSAPGHVFRGTGIGGAVPLFTEIDNQNTSNTVFAIPDLPTNSVLVDPRAPSVLFVAADFGVYVSPDSGGHWFRVDSQLPHSEIYLLDFNPTTNSVVAATHGRGMWQLRLPGDGNMQLRP
jgi:photosystem II stability/assembly factor-like uncharacterized protein